MIKYTHIDPKRNPDGGMASGHPVRLGPASPHTTARFCDDCNTEVRRMRPGEGRKRPADKPVPMVERWATDE